jgi:hypothetical protein
MSIVDFTALVVGHLKSDETIEATVAGGRLPDGATLPAVRVLTTQNMPAARPTLSWWLGMVQLDCLTSSAITAFDLAAKVVASLYDLIGNGSPVAVADVSVVDIQFVDDRDFTPPASRQIVTVDITARNPSNP